MAFQTSLLSKNKRITVARQTQRQHYEYCIQQTISFIYT